MPTQVYKLTASPTDLITADDITGTPLGLAVGTRYSGRYVGNGRTELKVLEAATAPDAGDRALPIMDREDIAIVPMTGENIYVWTSDGTGWIILNEVQ